MKALVTGATGFIGSHLADLLHERGLEVRCIARKKSNMRWLKDKPYEIVRASLDDPEALAEAVKGVDYVFHIAGVTFAKDYDEFLKGNRDGTLNLLRAVEEHNPGIKRFLFMSSQTVAGPSVSLDNPVDETSECKPLTSYGKSKKAAEDQVLKFKDKFPITIIRASAVFGPRDEEIFKIFKAAQMGVGTIVGFKPKYLSLIQSGDLVRGCVDAAFSDNTIGETYFISSDEFYTWPQLIEVIREAVGKKYIFKIRLPHIVVLTAAAISQILGTFSKKPPVFNYEKGVDFIQNYWICSVDKAKKDFGYKQELTIEDSIREAIDWYKENKWL
ncbi:MAG: NAD-dependent epimerase/dehydratase family protein [Candidatus Kapabacteria bacterium]|jgi:dihydroflavonol-4-reductase|nr:NAD-dependent epimerase/dehydratase family protein [Candidatus Kapabacteria bacterium]